MSLSGILQLPTFWQQASRYAVENGSCVTPGSIC